VWKKKRFGNEKLILKSNLKKRPVDTLYPIANFTATSVNAKVYRKALQVYFNAGFLKEAFRILF
jgi:hypothetical protein